MDAQATHVSALLTVAFREPLTHSLVRSIAAAANLSDGALLDAVALALARSFMAGSVSYEDADTAANRLFSLATSTEFWNANDATIPPLMFEIYSAIDAGEFRHKGDSDNIDPVEAYAKPELAAILARCATATGRSNAN